MTIRKNALIEIFRMLFLLMIMRSMPEMPVCAASVPVFSTPVRQYGYGTLYGADMNPSGTRIMTGSSDGKIRLWDASTGSIVQTFTFDSSTQSILFDATLSKDGTRILANDRYAECKLWDIPSGKLLRTFRGGESALAFSPDDSIMMVGTTMWDVKTGKIIKEFWDGGSWDATSLAFSHDGKYLLMGCTDGITLLIDVAKREWYWVFHDTYDSDEGIDTVAFSPDESMVLTVGSSVRLWSFDDGSEIDSYSGTTGAFSPDGKNILIGDSYGEIRMIGIKTGVEKDFVGHTDAIWKLVFSADGKRFMSASRDYTLRIWDTGTAKTLKVLSEFSPVVHSVAFSPDGKQILTGCGYALPNDNVARLLDKQTGALVREFAGHTDVINSVAFSSDGTKIVTGSDDKTAKIWDTKTGAVLHTLKFPNFVTSAVFSPQGAKVLTGCWDGIARIWDTHTGNELEEFHPTWVELGDVNLSPDGTKTLVCDSWGGVEVWDNVKMKRLAFFGADININSALFYPNGNWCIFGGPSFATLWDWQTATKIRDFVVPETVPHPGDFAVGNVATCSPDGKFVLAGGDVAALWETQTGKLLGIFTGHGSMISSVAFSPDSKQFLTAGGLDGSVRLWNVPQPNAAADWIQYK